MRRLRRRVRIGAPDRWLTLVSGMAAVTELVHRLGMIKLLDAAIGRIKARDRGLSGGQLLVGLASAQLAGEDFLVGLDRQRADVAGQLLAPVAGLSSTTAAGLTRPAGRAPRRGAGGAAPRRRRWLPAAQPPRGWADPGALRADRPVLLGLDVVGVGAAVRVQRRGVRRGQG
ncbi:MAG: hypothetical protein ACRDS0_36595, partial [Pseudonocardiaceae bacterium]